MQDPDLSGSCFDDQSAALRNAFLQLMCPALSAAHLLRFSGSARIVRLFSFFKYIRISRPPI